MNIYLVDFENVRADGIKRLEGVQEGDSLVVFYSETCKSITLDVVDRMANLKLKYSGFNVKVGMKNALDFQLSSYLGYLIGQMETGNNYYIVSGDKGFEVVADFWQKLNVPVKCVSVNNHENANIKMESETKIEDESKKSEAQKTETKKSPTKKSKISAIEQASLDEIKGLIGKGCEPSEVLKVFNQYKTKVAINNGLVKLFKNNKKAGEIYKKLKPLMKEKNRT